MRSDVAAAILDLGLNDDDGQALCDELKSRSIPFVVYSGYSCPATLDAPFIPKPTNTRVLVEGVEGLLEPPTT
jgi:DNA-binding NarL/FixJ family response regulator